MMPNARLLGEEGMLESMKAIAIENSIICVLNDRQKQQGHKEVSYSSSLFVP